MSANARSRVRGLRSSMHDGPACDIEDDARNRDLGAVLAEQPDDAGSDAARLRVFAFPLSPLMLTLLLIRHTGQPPCK